MGRHAKHCVDIVEIGDMSIQLECLILLVIAFKVADTSDSKARQAEVSIMVWFYIKYSTEDIFYFNYKITAERLQYVAHSFSSFHCIDNISLRIKINEL